jgi:hypothetical protein
MNVLPHPATTRDPKAEITERQSCIVENSEGAATFEDKVSKMFDLLVNNPGRR